GGRDLLARIGPGLARPPVWTPGAAAATDSADELAALSEREPAGGGDERRIEGGYVGAGRVLHDVKESSRRPPVSCRRASLALGNADRCHLRLVHLVEVDEIAVWIDD